MTDQDADRAFGAGSLLGGGIGLFVITFSLVWKAHWHPACFAGLIMAPLALAATLLAGALFGRMGR